MVELQIINKILQVGSIDILTKYKLTPECFLVEREKIDFILNHLRQFQQVPDMVTFLAAFPDFEVFEVQESDEYLARKLKEAQLFASLVPILRSGSDKVREDAFEGMEYLRAELDRLAREITTNTMTGFNIIARADERLQEYRRRAELHGLLGITTGIQLLDSLTHGWIKEDLVLIYARTNEGKSWLLLFFLVAAWVAGKKVLLYSGEMSETLVGFRFDTLVEHFSNTGLMSGLTQLGDATNEDVGVKTAIDYANYIRELRGKNDFIVLTQRDFGGKKPTVDELRKAMEITGADILGVDQISLMTDQRRGKDKRERFGNIAEDLYLLSEALQKPVLAIGQANREAAKSKKKEEETPELHEIAESDALPQNATRCLSMKVVGKVLRISIKKNRYGVNNKDILMLWDINHGIFKPMLDGQTPEQASEEYGF